jgi:hypothetical protein
MARDLNVGRAKYDSDRPIVDPCDTRTGIEDGGGVITVSDAREPLCISSSPVQRQSLKDRLRRLGAQLRQNPPNLVSYVGANQTKASACRRTAQTPSLSSEMYGVNLVRWVVAGLAGPVSSLPWQGPMKPGAPPPV